MKLKVEFLGLARELAGDAEARRALGARGTEAVLRRKGVVERSAEALLGAIQRIESHPEGGVRS